MAPVFQAGMDLIAARDVDVAMAEFGRLPAWFGDIEFVGGPGLTAPGATSEGAVLLQPGTHLVEYRVETDGIFHSYDSDPGVYGMVHEFAVPDTPLRGPRARDDSAPRPLGRGGDPGGGRVHRR